MHLNYHFLKFLCPRVQEMLSGFQVTDCYSQNKDELIIEWSKETQKRYLRAHILAPQIYYSFPENLKRAKRNSVDLFPELIGQELHSCKVLLFERGFYIKMKSGILLFFKLHGNRSNILLYHPGEYIPMRIFKNSLKEDHSLDWRELEKDLDLSRAHFDSLDGNASKFLPTLGKVPRDFLLQEAYPNAELDRKWELICQLLDLLESPLFTLVSTRDGVILTLLPSDQFIKQYSDPIEAVNSLFYQAIVLGNFEKEKDQLLAHYRDLVKRTKNFLEKTKSKLEELENAPPPSQLADVVMANLSMFSKQSQEYRLFDFYSQKEITVKLKLNQKPQEYAAQLYRKSKNRKLELNQLEQAIIKKEEQLSSQTDLLKQLEKVSNFKDLKEFKKKMEPSSKTSKMPESVPFRRFLLQGMEVWVGKSSKDNDEMLRAYAHKNDIWLHARQAPGSHTIIKNTGGKIIPNQILERAAALAAYYSKLKHETLAAVIYTEAKYVRKVKGSPAGSVHVDREKTILVKPQGPSAEIAFD